MKHFWPYLIVILVSSCREETERSSARQAAVQQHEATPPNAARADSARVFVQRFYDWYLATEAAKGSPYDSLLTGRRAFLGDSLVRALQADVALQRAATLPEIASLSAEADVFLNSQDPCPHCRAVDSRATANGAFAVVVAGDCAGLSTRPNLEVQVSSSGAGWHIENIKDPTNRTFDLLGAFIRYHREQTSPGVPKPAGRDSSRGMNPG